MGRYGILNDSISFTSNITSLGLNNSGVAAISEANTKSNHEVVRVYNAYTRFFRFVTIIVVFVFWCFATHISKYLTGDYDLTTPLRVSIFSLFFIINSQLKNTLIIGLQKIRLLVKANIYNGLFATALSVPAVIVYRENAIPYLVIIAPLVAWIISASQAKKVLQDLPRHQERLNKFELKPILLLGIATLYSGFLENIVNLIIKAGIIRNYGENHLGYYQISMGIAMMYISFITTSISNDYYPRLVAKIGEGKIVVNDFVNQQIGISMHLVMPVLIVMLFFSNDIIFILFSEKFSGANILFIYSIVGTLFRVICWPIAYVFLAHKATKKFLLTELIGNGSYLIFVFGAFFLGSFNFIGLGYLLHYVIYFIAIFFIYFKYYGGKITRFNFELMCLNIIVIGIVIFSKFYLDMFNSICVFGLVVVFLLFQSRKEYKLIFQSVFSKIKSS